MFICLECGKKYAKPKNECSKCGGSDIDIFVPVFASKQQLLRGEELREAREQEGMVKRASKFGSDFLDHDFSMNG